MRIQGTAPAPAAPKRRFNPLRDVPALLWLMATVVATLLHDQLATARWLMIHLLLLGAVSHSILVWSQHFADALLHAAPTRAQLRARSARIALLNAGALVVVLAVTRSAWVAVAAGAAAVALAACWHGAALLRQLAAALGSRFAVTVRYYVAAATLLPAGLLLGVLMARGVAPGWHARLMAAHIAINVFGWMGLTVLGTLVTLWPTMLRTRIAEGAERDARRSLWVLCAGIAVAVGGCLAGTGPLAGAGLVVYAVGLGILARPFVAALRARPPVHFPTLSVLAAVAWFAALTLALGAGVGFAPTWADAHALTDRLAPALAVGFGAQVLLGALSYLVPVSVGGGPAGVRAANAALDRGAPARIAIVNAGLPVTLLPVPGQVRTLVAALVLLALAAFVPLLFLALRAARVARDAAPRDVPRGRRSGPAEVAGHRPPGQRSGLAVAGLSLVVLAVAAGVALDAPGTGSGERAPASAGVAATGQTTHVVVEAADMRFSPDTVTVPAGNRLVIELRNTDDSQAHDLVLDSGARSPVLAAGESATIDVGVVGRALGGWCSMPGHRAMGMVFHIRVDGDADPAAHADTAEAMPVMPGMHSGAGGDDPAAAHLDFGASPGPGFHAHDAVLPPVSKRRVIRRTFTVSAVQRSVAPGVRQQLWTYNGSAPGPTLHGRVGDRFVIRLVNDTDAGHSIDFHAGQTAPDQAMRTLAPGQSLTYRFTARHSGIWMYHCSTMPMSAHIANGMFGAVVIDPPGLRPVAHSFLLVQSELYLGRQGGPVDVDKVRAEQPDAVVFNGYANQYDADPLEVRTGQRIRIWVLDAGPNRSTSFHVVGGQFDTVFAEGAYLLRPGNPEHGAAQVLALGPAQGGFVEMTFREPGHYPFVSHVMTDAERGAHGIIRVRR